MRSLQTLRLYLITAITLLSFLAVSYAQPQLSGAQSGILPPGDYDVIDDISVEPGHTWRLEPGVHLRFYPDTRCQVNGILLAEGVEGDSVRFMRYSENQAWNGIDVTGNSYLGLYYTVITGSDDNGIDCNSSILKLSHSRISHNSDEGEYGGGIYCFATALDTIMYSTISDNDGTGHYSYLGNSVLRGNEYSGQSGPTIVSDWSYFSISNCIFKENQESCILNLGGSPEIDSCLFTNNVAQAGAAIHTSGSVTFVRRSAFVSNHVDGTGGAIWEDELFTTVQIYHSVFSANTASEHGSSVYSDDAVIVNSIFVDHSESEAVYCNDNDILMLNNIFYNNLLDYVSEIPDPTPYGILDTVNVNGDSCDANFNLYIDPLFEPDSSPPWQLSPESPAIDAGTDLWGGTDPDSTLPDIGIHYFDQSAFVAEQLLKSVPREFSIVNAYPNPFNSAVRITWSAPVPGSTQYAIYTVTGRLVESGSINTQRGMNDFIWSAPNALASGMYVVRVGFDGQAASRRIVYLK